MSGITLVLYNLRILTKKLFKTSMKIENMIINNVRLMCSTLHLFNVDLHSAPSWYTRNNAPSNN
jgi:hypothetical protein